MPSSEPPHRARRLANRSIILQFQFRATGDPVHLDEAVTAARQAVEATPTGHHRRAMLIAFGQALRLRSAAGDLDPAITAFEQAVAAADPDYPSGVALSGLSGALTARYERDSDPDDLDTAVTAARKAVEAISHDDLALAVCLLNLGRTLRSRAEQFGRPGDLMEAADVMRRAAELHAASAEVRLDAARAWGTVARVAGQHRAAADGYALAVDLLPQVAWRGLDRRVQEHFLGEWSGLANDAACVAIEAGDPERAVELLDQGRSVLWTQALHLRSDSARLAERVPELAVELNRIRQELDAPRAPVDVASREDAMAAETAREQRRRLATRWDALVAHVRTAVDGFGDFLAPTPFPELRTAAVKGPVAILNASRLGSQALVVSASDPVRVIPLPELAYDEAVNRANLLLDVLARAGNPGSGYDERDRGAVLDLLDWLWRTATEPVLDGLGHAGPPRDGAAWPRVWWCPTGPLAMLPVHAAGRHPRTDAEPTAAADTVSGRVVSSYTSTLGTLLRAHAVAPPEAVCQLAVGMPETPNVSPLPGALDELEILGWYMPVPDRARHIVGAEATRAAVTEAIPRHSWLHLACHARQNAADPSRSAIALWDGPLSVADLASLRLRHADLAFLSACETAAGSPKLPDESIHLAAAIQLLGFRHVIATLWTIQDAPGARIAASVYGRIARGGGSDAAAAALHQAVEELRESWPADPLRWAAYIHLGL
jgi:tetratricopeptide (TPR) repeat protein